MPMIDVAIPESALAPAAEQALLARITDLVLEHEGVDPANAAARSGAWLYLHRPAAVLVGGMPAQAPHYRIVATVPEGQLDDDRRTRLVAAITAAVLEAEEGARPRDPSRVFVFPLEIPEGAWGAAGRINRLVDIMAWVTGDPAGARRYAQERLAMR